MALPSKHVHRSSLWAAAGLASIGLWGGNSRAGSSTSAREARSSPQALPPTARGRSPRCVMCPGASAGNGPKQETSASSLRCVRSSKWEPPCTTRLKAPSGETSSKLSAPRYLVPTADTRAARTSRSKVPSTSEEAQAVQVGCGASGKNSEVLGSPGAGSCADLGLAANPGDAVAPMLVQPGAKTLNSSWQAFFAASSISGQLL
mmetsp:Transcript_19263/g.61182  ORF Transcript_19263/g.61182 Transcript_19263/m.61182 type:complete len:204 (+) Transcript_19263:67-678(+)